MSNVIDLQKFKQDRETQEQQEQIPEPTFNYAEQLQRIEKARKRIDELMQQLQAALDIENEIDTAGNIDEMGD